MKQTLLICSMLLVSWSFLGCGGGYSPSSGSYPTANMAGVTTITIPASAAGTGAAAYGTNPLHIPVGGKVQWMNTDSVPHSATSDTAAFDTGVFGGGVTSSVVTFGTAGTYSYHCSVHGSPSMTGVIIVP